MNQKGFVNIVLAVLVVLLAGTVGYFTLVNKPNSTNNQPNVMNNVIPTNPNHTQIPTQTITPSPSNSQPSITVLSPNGGETWRIGDENIIRWSPRLPLDVSMEKWFTINLLDLNGNIVGNISADSGLTNFLPDRTGYKWNTKTLIFRGEELINLLPGSYRVQVAYGKDGNTYRDESNAPFTITAPTTLAIKIYLYNSKIKPVNLCNEVVAVTRVIPKTVRVATAAINELLKGPTSEERISGYTNEIPVGSKLNSLSIVNGEARADFSETTESGGGSCSMSMRTAQIRETLLQFSTIKTVKLSINGMTEDIFQP